MKRHINYLRHAVAHERWAESLLCFLGDLQLSHFTRYLPKEEEIIGFIVSVYGEQFTCISQWKFASYRADLYIEEKHLVLECDEHGHISYDSSREAARCKALHDRARCS